MLASHDMDFWRGTTIDMMYNQENGTVEGFHGWIVPHPFFRSQELTNICATFQARVEAKPKYSTRNHRRLYTGEHSDQMPPNTYDLKAAKRHFKETFHSLGTQGVTVV